MDEKDLNKLSGDIAFLSGWVGLKDSTITDVKEKIKEAKEKLKSK